MPLRMLEISAHHTASKTIEELAEAHEAIDSWHSAKNKDGRRITKILVHVQEQQGLMDDLQKELKNSENWRIVVSSVDASIPKYEEKEDEEEELKDKLIVKGQITREELYTEVEKGAELSINFLLLVILSAIVATIGLIDSNVAVIIGAMVIAPLLGPNLALAFGAAIGNKELMFGAIKTNLIGLGLTLIISAIFGLIFGTPSESEELMSRTYVGFDSIVLALASGAAGVLSLSTGLSGALVGVMVAVALMPPAVAFGLFLGDGLFINAYGAGLLLAANIVCVSLSAQVVFFFSGIKPRTWYERKQSEQSVKTNIIFWFVLLVIIAGLIVLKNWI